MMYLKTWIGFFCIIYICSLQFFWELRNNEGQPKFQSSFEIKCPPKVEVQCYEDIPNPDINDVKIINNENDDEVVIKFVDDVSDNNSCLETITRSYSATDSKGNVIYCYQTIIVNDTISPKINDLQDYTHDGCNSPRPEYLTTKWNDNCAKGGIIKTDACIDDGKSDDGCIQYRLYTFTVKDNCGNYSKESTRVSREYDMTEPEIVDVPDFTLENCNDLWPEFLTTTWNDNCATGGTIQSDAGVDDGTSEDGCYQYRLYTFNVNDGCGNKDSQTTRVARYFDVTNPEIVDVPDYTLENCNDLWPEFLNTTWTDNCSDGGNLQSDFGVDDGESEDGCYQYRLYTFTITDYCGNTDTETTRVARYFDVINPEIVDIADYSLP